MSAPRLAGGILGIVGSAVNVLVAVLWAKVFEGGSQGLALGFVLIGLAPTAFSILLLADGRRARYWAGAVLGSGAGPAAFFLLANIGEYQFKARAFVAGLGLATVATGGMVAFFARESR